MRSANTRDAVLSRSIDCSRLYAITGIITLSSNVLPKPLAANVIVASLPMTCAATCSTISLITGLTFPGMIELPGCVAGIVNLADSAARAAGKPANVVGDLRERDRDRLELPGCFDHPIFRRLCFEMVFRFDEIHAAGFCDHGDRLFGEIRMRIDSGPDGRSTERQLAQCANRLFRAHHGKLRLRRVAGKFLPESDRRRILQMRSPDFDDIVELRRLASRAFAPDVAATESAIP